MLCVTDDGAGIPPDVLPTLLSEERPRSHASLNGIGVCNVHKRLQMLYGDAYGLTIESEPGGRHLCYGACSQGGVKNVSGIAGGR